MPTKDQHVAPSDGKWSVRRAGASRASGIYATQEEAIAKAERLARSEGAVLYIHGRDGRIRQRTSYGPDPLPSKG